MKVSNYHFSCCYANSGQFYRDRKKCFLRLLSAIFVPYFFRVRAHFGQSNFLFFQRNGKRKYYLSLSYLHISKYRKKEKKRKWSGKSIIFFIFLILKLNSKLQKILLTAKSNILLFLLS